MGFRRIIKILTVLVLLVFASGCAVKFVYNQLDWLIPWYLDDYVTLDSEQQALLDQRLEAYLSWHRYNQLPAYADFLEWLAESSNDGLDAQEIAATLQRIEGFRDQLFARLMPALTDLFASLRDDQIDEMFARFERENERYHKRYVKRAERVQRERRATELRDYLERWTGELGDRQVAMIDDWSQRYRLMGRDFIAARRAWQQQLRSVLENRHDDGSLERDLQRLFSSQRAFRTPSYQRRIRCNEALLTRLYLDLDDTLDSYQRRHMVRTLRAYAEDFRELASQ